jgi:hypothetical protein
MGLWKQKEVFPIIARVIRELHKKSGGFIHHSSIEAGLLNDSTAGRLVRDVGRERGTTPEWEAMEMVAWFSQKYPGSPYEKEFERDEHGDGYLYRPRHAAMHNLYPESTLPPVLFARTGWMKYYNGPMAGDERPREGGKYNKTGLGHEAFNFHEIDGQLFGYFQPQMQASKIKLERIVPGTHGDVLNGVLVVFVATHPQQRSQRIVGWYRDATVYRNYQPSPPTERNGFNYFLMAKASGAVLLPSHLRTQIVPGGKGGLGQANICYIYQQDGKSKPGRWVPQALEFVKNYDGENLLVNPQVEAAPAVVDIVEQEIERSAGFQHNSRIRKAVELHAMTWAHNEFESRGYKVEDVSKKEPYDLRCTKPHEVKFVEVKGTQTNGTAIVLTAGEVNHIKENASDSVLCVVHGIIVKGTRRPKTSGGKLSLMEPFDLSAGLLKPHAFTFHRK